MKTYKIEVDIHPPTSSFSPDRSADLVGQVLEGQNSVLQSPGLRGAFIDAIKSAAVRVAGLCTIRDSQWAIHTEIAALFPDCRVLTRWKCLDDWDQEIET